MKPLLYGHPFASYVWKPLIALYERDVDFTFCVLDQDHPEHAERIAQLSPTGQFPALVDGETSIVQSNTIIEYLDLYHGTAAPLVPADARQALECRMMADVFDDYIMTPMQSIVADAMRPAEAKDALSVDQAHTMLVKTYNWLNAKLDGREWAASNRFTIADCSAAPSLFYSDWVHPIPETHTNLKQYRARLLNRPSVKRVVDEARPFRAYFPPGAPDRD